MNFLPCASVADGASSSYRDTMQEGDLVIVYEGPASMKAVYIDAKARFENRFGIFPQKAWIGRPFGIKTTASSGGRGWVHLLRPTPELWTQVLKHRTQILYLADIAMIISQLELRPGSVVLESGTGSGSLTHSLVRAITPTGHVHTFEFHAGRAEEAAKEFEKHGLAALVTVKQRNIEELGFPAEDLAEAHGNQRADAVFLDLPGPWKVVPSAAKCLRRDGRFCSFSPCIEQVSRTCEALSQCGFTDIITYECLLRDHEVHIEHLGAGLDLIPPPAKRQRADTQPAAAAAAAGGKPQGAPADGQAAAAQTPGADGQPAVEVKQEPAAEVKQEQQVPEPAADAAAAAPQEKTPPPAAAVDSGPGKQQPQKQQQQSPKQGGNGPNAAGADKAGVRNVPSHRSVISTRPTMEARGHTGYLTFARKFVTESG